MKVYLAARFSRQEEMKIYRDMIEALGHAVTSRWLNHKPEEDAQFERVGAQYAQQDMNDVYACDLFLLFTDGERQSRGGRHVELGMALAWAKRCGIVGPKENIFHWHHDIEEYADIHDVIEYAFLGIAF